MEGTQLLWGKKLADRWKEKEFDRIPAHRDTTSTSIPTSITRRTMWCGWNRRLVRRRESRSLFRWRTTTRCPSVQRPSTSSTSSRWATCSSARLANTLAIPSSSTRRWSERDPIRGKTNVSRCLSTHLIVLHHRADEVLKLVEEERTKPPLHHLQALALLLPLDRVRSPSDRLQKTVREEKRREEKR